MLKGRNTTLKSRVQGKKPQCSKCASSKEMEGSSIEIEREALLPSEAEGKKLCIENWPKEMDLVLGMSLCLRVVALCWELV